ncbi:MAG: alpha/beta hydrolase, partial [Proteobacteria bacterium]|nr:alpha/beta hydrolase [Pseudomonadota bacterium]
LSISGTLDGNVTPAKIIAGRLLLPVSTRYISIEGGNHNQFGSYRFQANDGTPTISRTEQQRQVVDATVAFLDTLGAP